jgi:nicotinate phosphoribosyltransferase
LFISIQPGARSVLTGPRQDFEAAPERAKRWTGLRQDSGDPFAFAPQAKSVYQRLGIDHTTKSIIYSDSLNVEKVLKLKEQCDKEGFPCAFPVDLFVKLILYLTFFTGGFGIGTSLTNDFHKVSDPNVKSKALNMVIKLGVVDGQQCIKISDDVDKVTGDKETAARVRALYKLA